MENVLQKLPLPGQWVKLRHTILSEAVWDGEKFILKGGEITCDPKDLSIHPGRHNLEWEIHEEEKEACSDSLDQKK